MSEKSTIRPYLDFYQSHKIAPVAQDISNLQKHFDRREALYRHLGIVPSSIRGRDIIEFGPGTGHNALFNISLAPKSYVLVDANPTSIEKSQQLFSEYFPDKQVWNIVNSDILTYSDEMKFDFVFCEGVITGQHDTNNFLKHVAGFTKPGGCLIITCIDSVSYTSELLRRAPGTLMADPHHEMEKRLAIIASHYDSHLKTLKDMSRSTEDWVLDNVLHPFNGEMLTIENAINALSNEFDAYYSSPHIISDWRWYKSIHTGQRCFNEVVLESYKMNIHNFLDYRITTSPRALEENQKLIEVCDEMTKIILKGDSIVTNKVFEGFLQYVQRLCDIVQSFSSMTGDSLQDYVNVGETYLKTGTFGKFSSFQSLFGRGQQYLSFIRK